MPSGFGYQLPRQSGTPDARAVGQMLTQRGQQPQQPAQAPRIMAPEDGSSFVEFEAQNEAAHLRREGAKMMGGPQGGVPDGAMAAAVGEALTRAGGGHTMNPNPHKNRAAHLNQLQQLGLSQTEAMLLGETL